MKAIKLQLFAGILLALTGTQVHAIIIDADNVTTSSTDCSITAPSSVLDCWSQSEYTDIKNPDASDVTTITGNTGIFELYKDNVGGVEENSFAAYYTTTFSNSATNPEDATISWDGPKAIECPECFLVVKDGNHDPSWYLFDIGTWDGMEDIVLTNFWPGKGAISHVTILGENRPNITTPEPGVIALLGAGLIGLGLIRRKQRS